MGGRADAMNRTGLLVAALVAGLFCSGSALADHWHGHGYYGPRVHFGVVVGTPYPYYAPPPYVYAPYYQPPVVIERPAPVYIERQPVLAEPQAAPPPPAENYWYYCAAARKYYPYVKECPGGWQRVAPQPPGQ
jgi:hypothetical protein